MLSADAPDEIGGEAAEQYRDASIGDSLPQRGGAVGDGDQFDRISGAQSIREAGAHDAGKRGDQDALFQIEFLDGGLFLLGRHLAFLGHTGLAGEGDTAETDCDADEDDLSGRSAEDFRHEFAIEDGRHKSAEGGAVAEGDGHAERHAEVAHGEPEGESAQAPHHAPEVAPEQSRVRGFAQHGGQVAGHDHAQGHGSNDPAEETANQPVSLPAPALDAAIGNIETAGSQTAQPVKDYAQKGIRCHIVNSEYKLRLYAAVGDGG